MVAAQPIVSDMLITVKSREIQRAMQARDRGNVEAARKHYLAAGHLELVLADDYEAARDSRLAFRSRLSAASCFWIGGEVDRGRDLFDQLRKQYPNRAAEVDDARGELEESLPVRRAKSTKGTAKRRAKRAKPKA
jgi:hypothetical protein